MGLRSDEDWAGGGPHLDGGDSEGLASVSDVNSLGKSDVEEGDEEGYEEFYDDEDGDEDDEDEELDGLDELDEIYSSNKDSLEEAMDWDRHDLFEDFLPVEELGEGSLPAIDQLEVEGRVEGEQLHEEGEDDFDSQLAALSRPSSTIPNEEEAATTAILDSLQNVLPELQRALPSTTLASVTAGNAPNLRMTDLGMRISQLVLRKRGPVADKTEEAFPVEGDDPIPGEGEDERTDAYLEKALSGRRRNRTGVRGRPKRVDYGFGKSTTHALPPEVSRIMGQANTCYVQRKYPDAIALLLEVVRQAPHAVEAYQTLGMIHEEQDDLPKAMSYFVIAAHLIKNDADLWRKLAKLTLQLGRQDEAIYYLSKLIRMRNPHAEYFWVRAKINVDRLEFRRAILSFNRLLFLSVEGDGQVFEQVALLAERLHHDDLIGDTFYQVLMQAIGAPFHRAPSLAVLLLALRRLLSTKRDDEKLISLIEVMAEPLVGQSAALPPSWYAAEPAQRLAIALPLLPAELRLYYAIAKVRLKSASPELYAFASGLDPHQHGPLMKELGKTLLAIAQANAALSILLPIMEVPSLGDADLGAMIGECYRLIPGLEEMAISTFEAVLEMAPDKTEVRTALCDLYRQQGRTEKATEVLRAGGNAVWRAAGGDQVTRPSTEIDHQNVFDGLFVWDGTLFDSLAAGARGAYGDQQSSMPVINLPTGTTAACRSTRKRRFNRRRKLCAYSEGQMQAIRQSSNQVRDSLTDKTSLGMRHTRQLALPLLDDMMRNRAILPDGNLSKVVRTDKRSLLHGLDLDEWLKLLLAYLIAEAGCGSIERAFRVARLFAVKSVFIYDTGACLKLRLVMLGLASRIGSAKFLSITARLIFKVIPNSWFSLALMMRALSICEVEMLDGALHRFLGRHALKSSNTKNPQLVYLGVSIFTERFEAVISGGSRLLANDPDDVVGLLATAVALLHQSLKRTCRNAGVLQKQALSLLYHLSQVDAASGDFNLARAYHMLGMLSAATHYYRQALRGPFIEEAAFNLYLLFMHLGNPKLASYYLLNFVPAV